MIYLYIISCFAIAAIGLRTEKGIFNPITIFSALWGTILFLSNFHAFGLDTAKDMVYDIFFVGIITFVIGYYITKHTIKNKTIVFGKKQSCCIVRSEDFILNYKMIYALALFCIPFYLKDLLSVLMAIGRGANLGAIQDLLQGNDYENSRSSIENALRLLIVAPFTSWMCGPLLAVEFWFGKRDKKLILLLFTLAMMRVFSTGGRATIIQLAFCFVCVYTFFKKMIRQTTENDLRYILQKNKRVFYFLALGIAAMLVWVTYSRAGNSALRTIYYDFAMQPLMFEKWAEKINDDHLVGYGIASLNGFLFPINYLLRNTIHISLGSLFDKIYTVIALTDSVWQYIGRTVRANAYVSIFWFFYLDNRIAGIVIGSFIYGIYSRLAYRSVVKSPNLKNVAIYSLIALGIFYTFGRFQFSQHTFVLALIYLRLFTFKRRSQSFELD